MNHRNSFPQIILTICPINWAFLKKPFNRTLFPMTAMRWFQRRIKTILKTLWNCFLPKIWTGLLRRVNWFQARIVEPKKTVTIFMTQLQSTIMKILTEMLEWLRFNLRVMKIWVRRDQEIQVGCPLSKENNLLIFRDCVIIEKKQADLTKILWFRLHSPISFKDYKNHCIFLPFLVQM